MRGKENEIEKRKRKTEIREEYSSKKGINEHIRENKLFRKNIKRVYDLK
jgi:hypothetical protein